MGIEPFIRKHAPYHKHACATVYRFYYGRLDLPKMIIFSMYVHQNEIAQNIMRHNPLFKKICA